MRPFVYPYGMTSAGAKALAVALGCKRIRVPEHRSRYRHRPHQHIIINWGKSVMPSWRTGMTRWVNEPFAVAQAANKRMAFMLMMGQGVSIPEWTHSAELAQEWLTNGKVVYGRKLLTGHSGRGIVIMRSVDDFEPCKLYTIKTPTTQEYRYHVVNDTVIDVQKKARRNGAEVRVSADIRNHKNGWIYKREGVIYEPEMVELARNAVRALCLDFGAVDIAWNPETRKAFVFEVNTAPGLHGTSVQLYRDALLEMIRGW